MVHAGWSESGILNGLLLRLARMLLLQDGALIPARAVRGPLPTKEPGTMRVLPQA